MWNFASNKQSDASLCNIFFSVNITPLPIGYKLYLQLFVFIHRKKLGKSEEELP